MKFDVRSQWLNVAGGMFAVKSIYFYYQRPAFAPSGTLIGATAGVNVVTYRYFHCFHTHTHITKSVLHIASYSCYQNLRLYYAYAEIRRRKCEILGRENVEEAGTTATRPFP